MNHPDATRPGPDLADDPGVMAFDAYCADIGYRNVRGEVIPSWIELGEPVRSAWRAAAAKTAADFPAIAGPEDVARTLYWFAERIESGDLDVNAEQASKIARGAARVTAMMVEHGPH